MVKCIFCVLDKSSVPWTKIDQMGTSNLFDNRPLGVKSKDLHK